MMRHGAWVELRNGIEQVGKQFRRLKVTMTRAVRFIFPQNVISRE